jgi:hypothetical protein
MASVSLTVPHYEQEFGYSCLPACVRMVLAFHGQFHSEADLRQLLKTTTQGARACNLLAVRGLGLDVQAAATSYVSVKPRALFPDLAGGEDMGILLVIDLEREVPGLKDNLGGKAWAHAHLELDEIATRLGVPDLSSFISMSAEDAAELLPPEHAEGFEKEWFAPAEGLRTLQLLLDYFAKSPPRFESVENAAYVIEDLREAEKVLLAAKRHKVRFHLSAAY